jgi:antirestriction protein
MNATTLDLTADIIDVRDIIARVEELEDNANPDVIAEHAQLCAILEELKGLGGDEQWEGHWYPVTLIRDSHFRTYAEELADDIDAVPKNAQWPLNCIDWEQAARELQWDYSAVDIDGATYWYR